MSAKAPDESHRLERLRALSDLLDNAFRVPGTNFRVGLDALIGLVPGVGDLIGTLASGYIIVEAARFGVPKSTLTRMLVNVAIESIVGAVPALGDLFDAAWKANARNLILLRDHVGQPRAARASSRRLVAAVVLLFLLVAAGGVWLLVSVARALS